MAEWIMATSSIITALTVIILWIELKSYHSSERRKKAIELIQFWSTNLTAKQSAARNLTEKLSFEQSKCLFDKEPFSIDAKYKELVAGSLDKAYDIEPLITNDRIQLTVKEVIEIKVNVVDFLNLLESILSAWRHNVADRDIIKEEFHFLVLPQEGHDLLENFRKVAGVKAACPAIESFCEFVLAEKRKTTEGKKPLP